MSQSIAAKLLSTSLEPEEKKLALSMINPIGFNTAPMRESDERESSSDESDESSNQLSREVVADNFPAGSSEDVEEVFLEPPQLSKSARVPLRSAQPSPIPAPQGLVLNLESSDESSELLQLTYSAKRHGKARPQ